MCFLLKDTIFSNMPIKPLQPFAYWSIHQIILVVLIKYGSMVRLVANNSRHTQKSHFEQVTFAFALRCLSSLAKIPIATIVQNKACPYKKDNHSSMRGDRARIVPTFHATEALLQLQVKYWQFGVRYRALNCHYTQMIHKRTIIEKYPLRAMIVHSSSITAIFCYILLVSIDFL